MNNQEIYLVDSMALRRSWGMALFLSVFFGWAGFDRFYLGSPVIGIIKFLSGGLFGILWVWDILTILFRARRGIVWR